MSWELILQIAALVLLGGLAMIVGAATWSFISETKHKRTLELIDRKNVALNRDEMWRERLGQVPEDG